MATNKSNPKSYTPADNYIPRAQAVVRQIIETFIRPPLIILNQPWKEPTPEMILSFVHELPGILNWVADGAAKRGIAARRYANRPLTEIEMIEVESWLAKIKITIIENDSTGRKVCTALDKHSGHVIVMTDQKKIIEFDCAAGK